jgi:hypothetical protein
MAKIYRVYLYRAPDCKRGWLAYLRLASARPCTVTVDLFSESGEKAKNQAQTLANKGFVGLEVVRVNQDDSLWGLRQFPDLAYVAGLVGKDARLHG